MSKILTGLFLIGIFSLGISTKYSIQNKLLVSVYYESKCPDSMSFINQVYPLYTQMTDYITLDFIPYGGTQTIIQQDGSFTFRCQHGPAECRGNKLHACAIAKLPASISNAFINCSMSQESPPDAGALCATLLQLDNEYPTIVSCVFGTEGSVLLNQNGKRTKALNPALYWVPWVTYDDIFYEQDFETSQSNLLPVICKHLCHERPTICDQPLDP